MRVFEKTFVEAFRAGEVGSEQIHDYVEHWYNNGSNKVLHEFLGMTRFEFATWIVSANKALVHLKGDEIMAKVLNMELAPPEMPVCKMCGRELGVRTADGSIICSSSYIEDNDYCYDCQLEHCMNTNCLGCTIGHYPDCEHLNRKKFYLEEERREREEEAKKVGDTSGSE